MFKKSKPEEPTGIDLVIDQCVKEMLNMEPYMEEYSAAADQLVKLHALKPQKKRVSPDTMAAVVGNIASVVIIVVHEQRHVITTKAMSLVRRLG